MKDFVASSNRRSDFVLYHIENLRKGLFYQSERFEMNIVRQATTLPTALQVGPTLKKLYRLTVRRFIRAVATIPFAVTVYL